LAGTTVVYVEAALIYFVLVVGRHFTFVRPI